MTFLGYEFYNDFDRLPTYGLYALGYFLVLFGTIIFHEIGHWIYFKRIGKNMKVNFIYESVFNMRLETGEQKDYEDMSDDDYFYSLWWGVLFGLVPIVISSFFFFPSLLMVIPYGVGCFSDLKEINKVYKNKGEGFLGIDDEDGDTT
jgi:hypothetical protein